MTGLKGETGKSTTVVGDFYNSSQSLICTDKKLARICKIWTQNLHTYSISSNCSLYFFESIQRTFTKWSVVKPEQMSTHLTESKYRLCSDCTTTNPKSVTERQL